MKKPTDEYTRISTPRSEVLFKKGYLMRTKKYIGPINSTATTSSNDSGSVSVVSNEETASYYSIQSMSPENSSYVHTNGTSCSDAATSATYPNDAFDSDLSLMYSSGFYDNNGYFYVNRTYPISMSVRTLQPVFLYCFSLFGSTLPYIYSLQLTSRIVLIN